MSLIQTMRWLTLGKNKTVIIVTHCYCRDKGNNMRRIFRWHLRFRSLRYLTYVRRYAAENNECLLQRETNRLIKIIEDKEKNRWKTM